MTDEAHLASIDANGLLSAREAALRGIKPMFPGGNALSRSLDVSYDLDDMVFLSFFNMGLMPKHQDARRRRPVLLKIAASVLYRSGVQVALGRANRSRTKIYKPGGALFKMDWELISGQVDVTNIHNRARYASVCDYEILVPKQVPRELILGTI